MLPKPKYEPFIVHNRGTFCISTQKCILGYFGTTLDVYLFVRNEINGGFDF